MHKHAIIMIMVGLLILLPLGACKVEAPATATPSPTKAPTAVTTPAPVKPPEAKPTKPREEVTVRLLTMTLGSTAYVVSFALAEIVNKNHPWLRVNTLESQSNLGNLVALANDPSIRKSTFVFSSEDANEWAVAGLPPLKESYKGARAIAAFAETALIFATLDKNIKTKADMDGKRVMLMQKGSVSTIAHEALFSQVWNIKPKLSYGTFEAIKDALKDGLVDVGVLPINGMPGPGYTPIPALGELLSTKDVYFINTPAADVRTLMTKGRFGIYPVTIPARAIGDKQPNEIEGYGHSLSWWADIEMSEEIVYEITKTIYDNAEKFKDYHRDGRMVTRKTMARIGIPEELFHPGALKFYREKGIKPGVD
jgi:hypothetical protein